MRLAKFLEEEEEEDKAGVEGGCCPKATAHGR